MRSKVNDGHPIIPYSDVTCGDFRFRFGLHRELRGFTAAARRAHTIILTPVRIRTSNNHNVLPRRRRRSKLMFFRLSGRDR